MEYHLPMWSLVGYFAAAGTFAILACVLFARTLHQPTGMRTLDKVAITTCILVALASAALGWSLR